MSKASTKTPAELEWGSIQKRDKMKALFIALFWVLVFVALVIFAQFAWEHWIRPELLLEAPRLFAK